MGDRDCSENFGEEIFWKTNTWKTNKEMRE
jgi:hypothetical protein